TIICFVSYLLCLLFIVFILFFFFFFQAEDGIRDLYVTGVQTCALPISGLSGSRTSPVLPTSSSHPARFGAFRAATARCTTKARRSEERRVGKECRSRWSADH